MLVFSSSHAATLEELRDTIVANTKEDLPKTLGKERLSKEEVEAARSVFEAAEEILKQDITDDFRIWTLKRKAVALVVLAYEETPRYFPILASELDVLDRHKSCAKISKFAEEHVLKIGIVLAVQIPNQNAAAVPIDLEALVEWMIGFAERYPGKESDLLIRQLLASIEGMPSLTQRDRRLTIVAEPLSKYFTETGDKVFAQKLRGIARRLTLPGKPMKLLGYDAEGERFDAGKLAGKVVFVQFWGTWCVPCREEFPHLIELYEKYRSKGFEIVGVNTGINNDKKPEYVQRFLNETTFEGGKKITWPNLLDAITATRSNASLSEYYGVENLPETVLIGRDGNVLKLNLRPSALELEIQNALSPKVTLDDLTEEERTKAEEALRRERKQIDEEIRSLQQTDTTKNNDR